MLRVEIRPLALSDLEEIWFYTFDNWSMEQADNYQDQLYDAFSRISNNPFLGREFSEFDQYRIYRYNLQSHAIFYHIDEELVVIIRVLHQMMSLEDYFKN